MEINDLPDDALGLIFEHLDLKTRVFCELTCQRWNKIMPYVPLPPIRLSSRGDLEDDNLYDYPRMVTEVGELGYHQGDPYKVYPIRVESFLKKHKRAKVLFLRVDEQSTLELCLETIEREWFNLHSLQLDIDCLYEEDVVLISQLRIGRFLTRIENGYDATLNTSSALMQQFYASCPKLEILLLGPTGLRDIRHLTALSHLKSLFISSPSFNRNKSRDIQWIAANLSGLRELKVDSIDANDLTIICNMQNLVTLCFKFRPEPSSDGLFALAQLKNLKNLSFACIEPGIDLVLSQVLSNCTNLRTLSIGGCVSEALLKSLPVCVPRMEVLDFREYSSQEGFSQAVKLLPKLSQLAHLKTLNISSWKGYFQPLFEFIKRSRSVRNTDGWHFNRNWHALRLFHAMNRKAMANRSEQFKLRIKIARHRLKEAPAPNLTLYSFN